jgi:uncharacterized protein
LPTRTIRFRFTSYLFGSKARGEAGSDSDYDLLVVVPDDALPERRRSRLACQALRGTATAADVVVCTQSHFEARRHLRASLPGTLLREGKLLHAARSCAGRGHQELASKGLPMTLRLQSGSSRRGLCSARRFFIASRPAEKALKGFLAWHDTPFRKTHDLEESGEARIAIDATLRETIERAIPLTEYAWKFRYPGEPEEPTREEDEEALAAARDVYAGDRHGSTG